MQDYSNHTHFPAAFVVCTSVIFFAFLFSLYRIWQAPSLDFVVRSIVLFFIVALAFVIRRSITTVQDRVIRLEMQVRMKQVLPADMQMKVAQLSHKQLVALRFACDAELPALVDDVVTNNITDGKTIKQKIKNWQADFLRA